MNVEKLQIAAGEDLIDLFGVCRDSQFVIFIGRKAPYSSDTRNFGRFPRNVGAKVFLWPTLEPNAHSTHRQSNHMLGSHSKLTHT